MQAIKYIRTSLISNVQAAARCAETPIFIAFGDSLQLKID